MIGEGRTVTLLGEGVPGFRYNSNEGLAIFFHFNKIYDLEAANGYLLSLTIKVEGLEDTVGITLERNNIAFCRWNATNMACW